VIKCIACNVLFIGNQEQMLRIKHNGVRIATKTNSKRNELRVDLMERLAVNFTLIKNLIILGI
jgi:hypothetical protein